MAIEHGIGAETAEITLFPTTRTGKATGKLLVRDGAGRVVQSLEIYAPADHVIDWRDRMRAACEALGVRVAVTYATDYPGRLLMLAFCDVGILPAVPA